VNKKGSIVGFKTRTELNQLAGAFYPYWDDDYDDVCSQFVDFCLADSMDGKRKQQLAKEITAFLDTHKESSKGQILKAWVKEGAHGWLRKDDVKEALTSFLRIISGETLQKPSNAIKTEERYLDIRNFKKYQLIHSDGKITELEKFATWFKQDPELLLPNFYMASAMYIENFLSEKKARAMCSELKLFLQKNGKSGEQKLIKAWASLGAPNWPMDLSAQAVLRDLVRMLEEGQAKKGSD